MMKLDGCRGRSIFSTDTLNFLNFNQKYKKDLHQRLREKERKKKNMLRSEKKFRTDAMTSEIVDDVTD